jgi:hypothetical protein
MSYDNLSSVSQNVLKFYQQLTDEETWWNQYTPYNFVAGGIKNNNLTLLIFQQINFFLTYKIWTFAFFNHPWHYNIQLYLNKFFPSNSFYPMSYDNLSSVSQNVLKFYQQLTDEERRVPFIFGRNNP